MKKISAALLVFAFGLLAFGIYRLIDVAWSQTATTCVNVQDRDRINVLTREGIDQAFRNQVEHLFTVWLKDPQPEPVRATRGMAIAISAYQRARANADNWKPQDCK